MALLNNKFDVLRGWPREGALDESFVAKVTAGVPVTLPPGTVVHQLSADGSVDVATTPNVSIADPLPVWVVVESNADFSGKFVGKVVCLRANAMFKLDPANYSAGVYNPGVLVSFSAGVWKVAAANDQVIGEVIRNDAATDGTITVYYDGGKAKKF